MGGRTYFWNHFETKIDLAVKLHRRGCFFPSTPSHSSGGLHCVTYELYKLLENTACVERFWVKFQGPAEGGFASPLSSPSTLPCLLILSHLMVRTGKKQPGLLVTPLGPQTTLIELFQRQERAEGLWK